MKKRESRKANYQSKDEKSVPKADEKQGVAHDDQRPETAQLSKIQSIANSFGEEKHNVIQRARNGRDGRKGSKHNRKNIRLAKTMGFHSSEFEGPITPKKVSSAVELRSRETEVPKVDTATRRRREQHQKHLDRLAEAQKNRDDQEQKHAGGIRRQEGGKLKLSTYRKDLQKTLDTLIGIPTPNYKVFTTLKDKGGMSAGANRDRTGFNVWKEAYNAAYEEYSNKGECMSDYREIAALPYRNMEQLDDCIGRLALLKLAVARVLNGFNDFERLTAEGKRDYKWVPKSGEKKHTQTKSDPKLKKEYPYGAANSIPHIHQYHGDFHLKIQDRGSVKRYNIVQNGRRHGQADDALRTSASNATLHALVQNILDTQV